MPTDLYTTRTLVRVLNGLDEPQTFLLDRFFPEMVLFNTERIDFDVLDRAQGLAPFVSPLAKGTAQKLAGYTTDSFTPAYVKPKSVVDPDKPLKRRPGEQFGGELSPQQRRDAMIADILNDHRNRIRRRKEWMAAKVLATGALTVVGEDYPSATVSFGRDAALTVALLTTSRWGESGVSPMDDIESWAELVASKSGAMSTDVVMDPKAWGLARADTKFKEALDNRRQMTGSVELGPTVRGEGAYGTYVGSIGPFDFWVYQQPYTDENGTAQNMLPDYSVILGSPQIEGYQAQGAIRDPRAGYQALEIFPKNWIEEDPPAEFVMSQSAPLVVPARPNATFYAKVHDAS